LRSFRFERSATPSALPSTMRNDTPYTPVQELICIKAGCEYWVYPIRFHGKPVRMWDRIHSRTVHRAAARSGSYRSGDGPFCPSFLNA